MELLSGCWAVLLVLISLTLSAGLVWVVSRDAPRFSRTINAEPHTLTILGAGGRSNPALYENFPDYPSALARQRALIASGRISLVVHSESGELRIDPQQIPGAYAAMQL